MNCVVTRDSVAAGDDIDAPHTWNMHARQVQGVEDLVSAIVASDYLPRIVGGKATWCISSAIPLAVVAEQWSEPRPVHGIWPRLEELDFRDGVVYCHVSYFAQRDPDLVLDVLRDLRVRVS